MGGAHVAHVMLGMRGVGQKTPCPAAVCASRLKTSRPTTNLTLICGLSFRAWFGTKIGLLGVCRFNGEFLRQLRTHWGTKLNLLTTHFSLRLAESLIQLICRYGQAISQVKIKLWVSGICILVASVGERSIRNKKERASYIVSSLGGQHGPVRRHRWDSAPTRLQYAEEQGP